MRGHKTIIVVLAGLLFLGFGQPCHSTDDQRAREIVDRVARVFAARSSIAVLEMQVFGEYGQPDLTMKIWTQGENALVRIISPEKDAGTTILKAGSDIWYYLPKVKRTIKAPSSMAMTQSRQSKDSGLSNRNAISTVVLLASSAPQSRSFSRASPTNQARM
jgi:outer membrane lipoprotein-sorting protein